jgi:hypothetical protein
MNARSGWGVAGGTDGASHRFHRQFWDAVFGENITEIGKANQDSKEDLISRINYPAIRWCYYQLNYFGDPSLNFFDIQNSPPDNPIEPNGKNIGFTNRIYNFNTYGIDNDSDDLYYRWDWGDGTFSDWIGPFTSNSEANASHKWKNIGKYNIRVKSCDQHRSESEWSEYKTIYILKNLSFLEHSNLIESIRKYFDTLKNIYISR